MAVLTWFGLGRFSIVGAESVLYAGLPAHTGWKARDGLEQKLMNREVFRHKLGDLFRVSYNVG
jgi:hypothetical protein